FLEFFQLTVANCFLGMVHIWYMSDLTNLRNPSRREDTLKGLVQGNHVLRSLQKGEFVFRTLDEIQDISNFLSHYFTAPEMATLGLVELMINAVEHGNLGIGYEEKARLLLAESWHEEVERRLALPEFNSKTAQLTLERSSAAITVRIKDEGVGFPWQNFMTI